MENGKQIKTIPAIETYYDGHRFRSRLEARWAVFFNALGVKYVYEPEGFTIDGLCYLPDFRVDCWGTRGSYDGPPFPLYIEVKGIMTEDDAKKIKKFSRVDLPYFPEEDYDAQAAQRLPLLVVGEIPNFKYVDDVHDSRFFGSHDSMGFDVYPFNYETIDGDYFAAYPAADEHGRFYLMGDDCNYINSRHCPKIFEAYKAARQARFEHGEKPMFTKAKRGIGQAAVSGGNTEKYQAAMNRLKTSCPIGANIAKKGRFVGVIKDVVMVEFETPTWVDWLTHPTMHEPFELALSEAFGRHMHVEFETPDCMGPMMQLQETFGPEGLWDAEMD